MTEYEEVTLKLKMVELTQNQSIIALLAAQVGTITASEHSIEASQALNVAIAYAEKVLKIN